jgi:hypothetical protein
MYDFGNIVTMSEEEVSKINAAIRNACHKVLPYNAIREDGEGGTQVISDIVQEVWVKTLEKGDLGGRAFAIETKNVIRDWMRREFPVMPVSQMTLQPADAEDEDSELLMPWDKVSWGASNLFDTGAAEKTLKVSLVHEVMKGFSKADQHFVYRYLLKKRKHSNAQVLRFKRLMTKLRNSLGGK